MLFCIRVAEPTFQDTICIERCRRIHVCVYCATKRNITGGQLQCAKLRMDCTQSTKREERQYICAHCDIPSILHIDMLGRIAHIGDQKILLSLCCASLVYYRGSGHEFDTECGPQCARNNQFSKARSSGNSNSTAAASSATRNSAFASKRASAAIMASSSRGDASSSCSVRPVLCFVCKQKNVAHSFQLLHAATRAIQMYHLCPKHNLNVEIVKQLDDEYDLVRALRCNGRIA